MKNRITSIVFVLFIIFTQVSCSSGDSRETTTVESIVTEALTTSTGTDTDIPSTEVEAENTSTPLFWKVTGNGYEGNFYLLGSIHIGNEYTNLYPAEVIAAYDRCEYLAVESDVVAIEQDEELLSEISMLMLYDDGSMLYDHVDRSVYEDARSVFTEKGLYIEAMDMFKPYYWMMLMDEIALSFTSYSSDMGVDLYFLNDAKEQGKTILEVEDALETYEALFSTSDKTQEFLLKQVADPDYMIESIKNTPKLYSIWKTGDIDGFNELMAEEFDGEMTAEDIEAYNEYNEAMQISRDKHMIETAVEYMEEGKDVFYIVGLAHMLSDTGLVEGLSELGYTVTQVEYETVE